MQPTDSFAKKTNNIQTNAAQWSKMKTPSSKQDTAGQVMQRSHQKNGTTNPPPKNAAAAAEMMMAPPKQGHNANHQTLSPKKQ
jgi:hypothetical protein